MEETPHLEGLNEAQRAAVTFDVPPDRRATPGRPLLIIAGAGSGKTNTLAHRVAHLILHGADPRRILLLTFTRRAAEEMTRRVERICGQEPMPIWPARSRGPAPSMPSAPGCCASTPSAIGLDPAFTVLDRGDAADLHRTWCATSCGLSEQDRRFPKKATCLAIYSLRGQRPDRARAAAARRRFPGAATGQAS